MGPGRARPINFQRTGRGQAQPPSHLKKLTARPGPLFFISLSPARPITHGSEAHETRVLYGQALQIRRPAGGFGGRPMNRPMCCPVLKGACAYADVIVFRELLVYSFFSVLDSVGQVLSAHETQITSTQYSRGHVVPGEAQGG